MTPNDLFDSPPTDLREFKVGDRITVCIDMSTPQSYGTLIKMDDRLVGRLNAISLTVDSRKGISWELSIYAHYMESCDFEGAELLSEFLDEFLKAGGSIKLLPMPS